MLNLKDLARFIGKVTKDNSPMILTVVGVTGTLSTAVFTARATYRAAEILIAAQEDEPLPFKEKVKMVWHLYIPPLSVAAVTVSAIILSNKVGTRRAAALATAYTTLDQGFTEYREKIVEKIGASKERTARDEIAQERVNRNPPTQSNLIITGKGLVPCLDSYANRWFESDYETVRHAVNTLNERIYNSMESSATLNEFYDLLGIPSIRIGDEMGWHAEDPLKIDYSTTTTDDMRPGFVITFRTEPVRNPFRTH